MNPRDFLRDYERRLACRDFNAIAPLVSAAAIFWFNDGSFVGPDAIRDAFERTFAAFPQERYWLEDVAWAAEGSGVVAAV